MPISTSPSTLLYQLGKGIISIGDWVGAVAPTEYTDVGNCPSLSVEVTEEVLDHYSSRSGTKKKDKSITLESGYKLSFDLDEISILNLKMYLKGTLLGQNVIRANTDLNKEYAIKFISDNPTGPDERWEFWKVKLSPNGAFSLIGDDWSKVSFNGEGLADEAGHATSPYFNVTFVTTTSSTTTTTTTTA